MWSHRSRAWDPAAEPDTEIQFTPALDGLRVTPSWEAGTAPAFLFNEYSGFGQGADVYLLDDPLAAVDAHVGKHLWNSQAK